MNRKIARKAIARIAKLEGIKESEVREEMSRAILECYFWRKYNPLSRRIYYGDRGDCSKIKEQYTL